MSEIEGVQPNLSQGETEKQNAGQEAPIDKLLLDKMGALRCIVDIDEMLQSGLFLGVGAGRVIQGQKFLKELYAPIRAECVAHPDWLRASDPKAYEEKKFVKKAEEKRVKKAEKKGLLAKLTGRAN